MSLQRKIPRILAEATLTNGLPAIWTTNESSKQVRLEGLISIVLVLALLRIKQLVEAQARQDSATESSLVWTSTDEEPSTTILQSSANIWQVEKSGNKEGKSLIRQQKAAGPRHCLMEPQHQVEKNRKGYH